MSCAPLTVIVTEVGAENFSVAAPGSTACDGCRLAGMCGHRLFRRTAPLRLDRADAFGAMPRLPLVGEQVLVEFDDQLVLRAAALVYGLPLAGLLFGAVTAAALFDLAIVGAVLGFFAGYRLAQVAVARASLLDGLRPRWRLVGSNVASP